MSVTPVATDRLLPVAHRESGRCELVEPLKLYWACNGAAWLASENRSARSCTGRSVRDVSGQRDFRRRTNPMPKPAPGVNAP